MNQKMYFLSGRMGENSLPYSKVILQRAGLKRCLLILPVLILAVFTVFAFRRRRVQRVLTCWAPSGMPPKIPDIHPCPVDKGLKVLLFLSKHTYQNLLGQEPIFVYDAMREHSCISQVILWGPGWKKFRTQATISANIKRMHGKASHFHIIYTFEGRDSKGMKF